MIQSILIQTLIDSYYVKGGKSTTPVSSGTALHPSVEGEEASAEDMSASYTILVS